MPEEDDFLDENEIAKVSGKAKIELIRKEDGQTQTFLMPINEKDSNKVIGSFRKWDKTFRIYWGIYTKAHPERANEMLQYANTIETAAETFALENAYAYDEVFCNLMEEFPQRPWEPYTSKPGVFCLLKVCMIVLRLMAPKRVEIHMAVAQRKKKGKYVEDTTRAAVPLGLAVDLNTNVLTVVKWDILPQAVGKRIKIL